MIKFNTRVLFCLISLWLPSQGFATSLIYFGLTTLLPQHATVFVQQCLLDLPQTTRKRLNQTLQKNPRWSHLPPSILVKRWRSQFVAVSAAQQCLFEAVHLGVTELPAVVINRRYVIYGERNIEKAKQTYQDFLRSHDAN